MSTERRHIMCGNRMKGSFIRTAVTLCLSVLIFSQTSLQAQVISNNNAAVNLHNGVAVSSGDVVNAAGNILNNGNLNLSGNYTNTGTTTGDGFYRLGGNWTNSGVFSPGLSTVIFNGLVNQTISATGGENFYNLSLSNSGAAPLNRIILSDNVTVAGTLTMISGNIDTYVPVLFLNNPAASSLSYLSTTGSRVLGKFERMIGEVSRNYLFPLGTPQYYNPANLRPGNIQLTGSVLSQFITSPAPGYAGLPLSDPPVDIDSVFQDGYWDFKANGFSTGDFDIDLNATGFNEPVTSVTRIVMRTAGGDWEVDGMHHIADTVNNVVYRNNLIKNISPLGTQFAIGRPRPLILRHPRDTTVCENANPVFTVVATGPAALKYEWYKEPGVRINNGPHYSGARTASLTILGAQLSDAGEYYCIVSDRYGNEVRTNSAYLTVKKVPVATVSGINPGKWNHECSGIDIDPIILGLTHWDNPGTIFLWERDEPAGIETTVAVSGTEINIGDVITGSFKNVTNQPVTITFRITPVGPDPTYCRGASIPAYITVNPTPKVEPLNSRPEICNETATQIILTTPTTMTTGHVVFDYTVMAADSLSGNTDSVGDVVSGHTISRAYRNTSHGIRSVYYTIIPVNKTICAPGPSVESEVKVHAKPILDIRQTKPLTCDGGSGLGALKAIVSTGADPLHILWTGPDNYRVENRVEIDNLSSGAYYATVTDNLGCMGYAVEPLIPEYATPYIFPYHRGPGDNHVSCIGAADGRIRIGVQSGITAPYLYRLLKNDAEVIGSGVFTKTVSEGESLEFGGLEAGVYMLIITDKYGCERIRTVTLKSPPPISVIFGKQTYQGGFNVSCKGYDDGSIWVETIQGGRGGFKRGFQYRWFTSDGLIPGAVNTNRIDNVIAGTYYLEVTDTLECKAVFQITLTQPEGMELGSFRLSSSPDNAYNVSCNGGSDGSISMTVQGGSGTFSYEWTGPDGFVSAQKDISGLRAGVYSCIVTDINGCILSPVPTFTLTQPAPVTVSLVTSVSADGAYQINCHGGTGSVIATASGGSLASYTYTWSTADGSGIVQGNRSQTALTAGTYHIEVKDGNNCVVSRDITLTEPPEVKFNFVTSHITCESTEFNNGAINLTVTGGAGPMTYRWSNGATMKDISGLTEGLYRVDVTYNNTCTATGSVRVNLPPPLVYDITFSNYNSYEISCFGMANGEIHITPKSGEAPFMYSWTGPNGFTSSSADLTGLKAGIYNLKITDANQCIGTEVIEMRQPGEIEARLVLPESLNGGFNLNCAGDNNGTIVVNPQNAVNNVSYLWSDGFMGRNRTDLRAGVYTVVITDDNNCQAIATATITQPDSLRLTYEVMKPFCPDMPDGEIRINVTGGVPGAGYSVKWSDNSTGDVLSGIAMGEFIVVAEDMNGCRVRQPITVKPQNEACLVIPNVISPNGDLINDYWNIGMKELYPQMEVRIFNRWGETVWRSAKGYPDPWDGRSNGSLLPIDSYHYIIDLHNGSKPIIGNVTIVR